MTTISKTIISSNSGSFGSQAWKIVFDDEDSDDDVLQVSALYLEEMIQFLKRMKSFDDMKSLSIWKD